MKQIKEGHGCFLAFIVMLIVYSIIVTIWILV